MGGGGGGGSPAGSVAVTTGYDRIMAMCKSVGASITFTCAEMSDREHNPGYLCGPEGLLRQVVAAAARPGWTSRRRTHFTDATPSRSSRWCATVKEGDRERRGDALVHVPSPVRLAVRGGELRRV